MSSIVNYEEKGLIFNIQRFSVNDGPGLRTIVFLKGCPLDCLWCSNPESKHPYEELMFNNKNCIGCHNCENICEYDAIDFNNSYRINKEKCINCNKCVDVCYSDALVNMGQHKTIKEVLEIVKKDFVQFRRSGGGVTLSGGEPLMQPKFSKELLKGCKESLINTAIETTAFAESSAINEVFPWVDLALIDIKNIDDEKHKKYVGQSNKKILENIKLIDNLCNKIIIRVPIIPNFNCDEDSIRDIARFAKNLNSLLEIHILPYHRLGVNKYECLGIDYKMPENISSPTKETMEKLKNIVEEEGIKCNIGAV